MFRRGMPVTSFRTFAIRYAKSIGRNENIKLTFGGKIAKTNGSIINLPALPVGTVMSSWDCKIYGGYLDHEIGHVRFTDFGNPKIHNKQPIHFIWNVLEDIRIENQMIRHYPGTRETLDALCYHIDEDSAKEVQHPPTWSMHLFALFYKEAYAVHRGIDTNTIQGWLKDDPRLEPIAALMARDLPVADSEGDTWDLAEKILQLMTEAGLEKVLEEEKEKDESPFKGKELGDLTPAEMNLLQILVEAALEAGGKLNEKTFERKESLEKIEKAISVLNKEIEGEDKTKQRSEQKWGDHILPPISPDDDLIYVPSNEDLANYAYWRDSIQAELMATKKMLQIFLRAQTSSAWSRGLETGRLDDDKLAEFMLGNKLIHKERRMKAKVQTAVELSLDLSSSMSQGLTTSASILMAEALDAIPYVKLSIAGWSCTSRRNNTPRTQREMRGYGRLDSLDILLFKDFDEPYQKVKARIGGLRTRGSTPLAEGYGHGLEHLLPRKEPKKVLWVVSDGDSFYSCGDQSHSDYEHLAKLQKKAKALGVETVGLGIGKGTLKLKGYVERYHQIKTIAELPEALMGMVKEIV